MSAATLRACLRSAEITRRLREAGAEPPSPPDERLARLATHLGQVWEEADISWRMAMGSRLLAGQVLDPQEMRWSELVTLATAEPAGRLAEAEVISLSRQQAEILPPVGERETIETLTAERLPWDVCLIEVNARVHECPRLADLRDAEADVTEPVRWAAALCVQEREGMLIAGFATLHPQRPDELSAPAVLRVARRPADDGLFTPGLIEVSSIERDPDVCVIRAGSDGSLENRRILAMAVAARVAAVLQILSAVNVDLPPRGLTGKRRRRWERERHPVPHVISVRRRSARASDTEGSGRRLTRQHTVRGHWMHVTRGPIFDANPQARRFIPQLGREAVRIWRAPHIRGPVDTPIVPTIRKLDVDEEENR